MICVLLGLVGQLALQSQAQLDETPRATFERLTGLQIGPVEPAPISHAAMMPMGKGMMHSMVHHSGQHHHHHHDATCPLCPLLHLPAVVLLTAVPLLLTMIRWARWRYLAHAVRAPPAGRVVCLPPATGPPSFA
ncbi:hypothetical protein Gbfr_005_167 [Gluconobacter frateurii M-2]|nr:hypothetical protein Gbfr_005_167 [Gluconobacter frateurii M-2]